MSDQAARDFVERAFESRRQRRAELARLPIEQKLADLLDLQRTVSEIAISAGRPGKPAWPREIIPRSSGLIPESR